ncbi:hypothetical protein I6N95_03625 [Vagococcus sp. BWB3-3]|uniref:Uncharacterized protein n=1 Tax=Vagococcus allomyrinae TaxID=2794353 RepID=A0A940P8W5_9ENTE|nr:hypothetical protein [Vagococcus allomyrinae]MBP1040097.1 hypothetical protein [Vagococcus allomyrinae]
MKDRWKDRWLIDKLSWQLGVVREECVEDYLDVVDVMKDEQVTKETIAMMTGIGPSGKEETLLFDRSGCLGKSTQTPLQLLDQFLLIHQGFDQEKWRQSLNFFFRKSPKHAAYVTPDVCFSRVTDTTWVNLSAIVKYHSSKVEGFETSHTIIDFFFGGSFELPKGIKSVRQTLWTDTHEFWSIQVSQIFGAKPQLAAKGLANPTNPLMTNKFEQAGIVPLIICPKQFIYAMQIFTDLLPLYYEHVLRPVDIDLLPPSKRRLFWQIVKWKEGLHHDE